jgi:ABC-type oligopeptide transport system ATPase subunit
MPENLLEVRNLRKYFPIRGGVLSRVSDYVQAVDNVSFSIKAGETFGLVGESGCGKTTTGRAVLRLIEPDAGDIQCDGIDLQSLDQRDLRSRRRDMQIIFQDPYVSLNPRMPIRAIVGEPSAIHQTASGSDRDHRVAELLETVGLDPKVGNRYPHEFSGGQRQRIGIVRALAMKPKLIVADEPVSALDVSIQAQIINLLADLQEQFGLTYLFISHGIPVIEHISNRIGVMYLGKLVEVGTSAQNLCQAAASLHSGIVECGPGAGTREDKGAHHPARRCPNPDQLSVGLSVSHTLSHRGGPLSDRGTTARTD